MSYGTILILTIFAILLISSKGSAAGGSCPSGTNYLEASTNSLVTLSSLGVTNCYYISAAGADTNNGTSESTPWLHLPGMPNCSGTCAATKPAGGTGFILRGGDTWHFGNSAASPYVGGTWGWSWNGSSGSPIYIGVDPAWYSGGSWARPVMSGDNPLSTTAVASCAYQTGSGNTFLSTGVAKYVTYDNLEWTGKCQKSYGSYGSDVYIYDASTQYVIFEHNYIHGWTHIAWSCSGGSGICYDSYAWLGGQSSGQQTGDQYLYNVVDGSDSDPAASGIWYDGVVTAAYNVLNNASEIVASLTHLFHDNLVMNWIDPGDGYSHGNVYEEVAEPSGTNAIYNNVWANLYNTGTMGVCFWPEPPTGASLYVFNNVWYNADCGGNYIDIGQNNTNQGPIDIFNNTFENPQNAAILTCASSGYSEPFTAANNHYITDATSQYYASCSSGTKTTELLMTHATATADGYTPSETYAYSPSTSGSSPTAGTGTNETSNFCSALATAATSDPTLSNAATSCESDTTYACSYNSTNHTVSCPMRTVTGRPSSAAWSIGAYQSTSSVVQPPTNVNSSGH